MKQHDNRESGLNNNEPLRIDTYDYQYFSPEQSPDGELLARQIQAQSYVNMRIVRPEGLVILENGAQVLAPDAVNPPGYPGLVGPDTRVEYALGVEKNATDMNPLTGRLVSWKKLYAPLDILPTYHLCKRGISPEGEDYLRQVASNPTMTLVETEALGKTVAAGPGVVKEFIRAEIQRALGRGEVWLMGLVHKTAYRSFVHNWGEAAVRQIGAPQRLSHAYLEDDIELIPTVIDIDAFFANMVSDILRPDNQRSSKHLLNFLYMVEGITDDRLSKDVAAFRAQARQAVAEGNGDKSL